MPTQKAEALFDFKPTAGVELELKKGDVVLVRRTSVGEGWWEGEHNGRRGLFPSSFVKVLPPSAGGSPVMEKLRAPLTPGTSKKAFMETLLTPSTNIQEQIFDKDKANDLFVQGHSNISISAGPRWDCFPPTLTVVIKNLHTESRFSGVMHFTVFDVETKQLGTQVTRRYKTFLWLYDKLAELFPCISLPPLPVKQFSGLEEHGLEARRRGLENFLNRVANHPVLGSTKLLHDFLTQKDDKDWKIGRHVSNVKLPKSAKKLFNAPVYSIVKYPPFNVPINQLPSIERFSHFSRHLELHIQAIQHSCRQLCHSNGEMMYTVSLLGKDFQKMAQGAQPNFGVRRKVTPVHHHTSTLIVPNGQFRSTSDIEEEESDGEMDKNIQWNWRDDSKFNCMMKELYDVAGGMRKLSNLYHDHQESVEHSVLDALADYVGIIPTLPTLVRLHEEAMETYNTSKEKDTKKEAEEVRQHCETLNNIILAEFDYFSRTMVEEFENVLLNLLKEQADFHRKVANDWERLYQQYTSRRASRAPVDPERITSSGKSFSFEKSGSYTGSFSSSHPSDGSYGTPEGGSDQDSTLVRSLPTDTSHGPSLLPMYINVERMDSKKQDDSWERIDDPDHPSEKEDKTVAEDPSELESSCENAELYESVIVHELEMEEEQDKDEEEECFQDDKKEEIHSYANFQVLQEAGSIVPKHKSAPSSPVKPKKPMPIRRKQGEGESNAKEGPSSLSSSLEISTSEHIPSPPLKVTSTESIPSPPLKVSNTETIPSPPLKVIKLPQKPLPPAKPQRFALDNKSPSIDRKPLAISTPTLNQLIDKSQKSVPENISPSKSKSTGNVSALPIERKPRSKTTLESIPDKKRPLLPPTKTRNDSRTTDDLPSLTEKEPPMTTATTTATAVVAATTATVVAHNPPVKPKLSEPLRAKVQNSALPKLPSSSSFDAPSHTGREELMRKLSLRRQRLEQQLETQNVKTHAPNMGNITETPSERNSTVSTSSSHSEVVVKYSTRQADESSAGFSSNGSVPSNSSEGSGVVLRKQIEDQSLTKFGIIEDTQGGSFVI